MLDDEVLEFDDVEPAPESPLEDFSGPPGFAAGDDDAAGLASLPAESRLSVR